MELYLVRHPEPDIAKGVCYGQADIPIKEGALQSTLESLRDQLPQAISIYSSPLRRCKVLAKHLGPFEVDERLSELNFGDWELKKWDDIPFQELEIWMKDYINQKPSNGETGNELHERVGNFLKEIKREPSIIVGHLGSLRSIYAHVNNISLGQAFEEFNMAYGEVFVLRTE